MLPTPILHLRQRYGRLLAGGLGLSESKSRSRNMKSLMRLREFIVRRPPYPGSEQRRAPFSRWRP
jgi:hypothetical protein